MLNAPYNGGTHLPDITVVTPVLGRRWREVLFYTSARGHQTDVGGLTPGSMPPDSRVVEDEGVLIDNFKTRRMQGHFREAEVYEMLTSATYPARNPPENIADLKAQVAACEKGAAELRKMVAHFGLDVVQAYMAHVQDNAEELVRRRILALPRFRICLRDGPGFRRQAARHPCQHHRRPRHPLGHHRLHRHHRATRRPTTMRPNR